MDRGVLDVFCEEKTLYEATEVSNLLRGTRRRNHPTSCPPIKSTGLNNRADQAHRVELTARSISFGCLIEINFCFCLLFLRKDLF